MGIQRDPTWSENAQDGVNPGEVPYHLQAWKSSPPTPSTWHTPWPHINPYFTDTHAPPTHTHTQTRTDTLPPPTSFELLYVVRGSSDNQRGCFTPACDIIFFERKEICPTWEIELMHDLDSNCLAQRRVESCTTWEEISLVINKVHQCVIANSTYIYMWWINGF